MTHLKSFLGRSLPRWDESPITCEKCHPQRSLVWSFGITRHNNKQNSQYLTLINNRSWPSTAGLIIGTSATQC